MNEIKVDKNVAALKLIEILLEKGMINQATYTNIVKHANSHISQSQKSCYLWSCFNRTRSTVICIGKSVTMV